MSRFWRAILALAFTFPAYTLAWLAAKPGPIGDEPRYLANAISLAEDGDFDLANQARENAVGKLYPSLSYLTFSDYCMCATPRAPMHNPQGVGLSLVLAPFLALGVPANGLRVVLALIAALAAWQLLELMRETLGAGWHVWAAWAAVVFSAPIVVYATQFYPDVAAALLIIVSLRLILRSTVPSLIAGTAAAAFLPWFHLKLVPITAALIVAAFVLAKNRRRALLGAGLVVIAAILLYGYTSYARYGSVRPSAAYRDYTTEAMHLRDYAENFYRNVVGGLLSATYGWIPYAPIHWIGLAGLIPLLRRFPRWSILALAAVVLYLASLCASNDITHGWAPPGRLLVVLIPFIAFPLWAALRSSRALCAAAFPLAVLSALLTVQGAQRFQDLYPLSLEVPGLPLQAKLAPAWPLFRETRGDHHVQVGMRARPENTKPGNVMWTNALLMTKGYYEASIDVKALEGPPRSDHPVLVLRAVGPRGEILAQQNIFTAQLSPAEFRTFRFNFAIFEDQRLHVAVHYTGLGAAHPRNLWLKHVTKPPSPFQSWPLSACWILSAILTGMLVSRPPVIQRAPL